MIRIGYLLAQELVAQEVGTTEAAEVPGPVWGWLLLAAAILGAALYVWTRRLRGSWLLAVGLGLIGVAVLTLAFPSARQTIWTGTQSFSGLLRRTMTFALRHPFPFPIGWGILAGAIGLILAMPRTTKRRQQLGTALSLLGLLATLAGFNPLGGFTPQVVFWFLAVLTLGSAAAAIAMRSPVYTAIWFAISLLGTAGLFLYQGAEFLGVATVVVYAGAIVVTFLFVLMLAQPEGHATYDRISWGSLPKPIAVLTGAWLLATLTFLFTDGAEATPWLPAPAHPLPVLAADGDPEPVGAPVGVPVGDLHHPSHMAHLGGQLFGRHLISVELAGTLLLIALVGAVAIVIQGKRDLPAAGTATEPRDVPGTGANRVTTSGAPGDGTMEGDQEEAGRE